MTHAPAVGANIFGAMLIWCGAGLDSVVDSIVYAAVWRANGSGTWGARNRSIRRESDPRKDERQTGAPASGGCFFLTGVAAMSQRMREATDMDFKARPDGAIVPLHEGRDVRVAESGRRNIGAAAVFTEGGDCRRHDRQGNRQNRRSTPYKSFSKTYFEHIRVC